MSSGRQTVERRQLGLMLKRLRERAGRSQAETARAIGKDQARLSRVELGTGSLSPDEIATLLDFVEVDAEERATVLSLGAETRKRQRRRGYTDLLPGDFARLADLEADAVEIRGYDAGAVPGLMQSPEYVRALLNAGNSVWWESSEEELARRVDFRLAQQRRVIEATSPKKLHFVFTEDALHYVVGSPAVMRGQVLHLLQLGELVSDITIQILPFGAKDNPAPGGGLILLDFVAAPAIGFVSVLFGPCTYHDQKQDIDAMARAFGRVSQLALSPEESRGLLIKRLKEQ
ncbi:helix-turn-helix domain-containing protein [Actinoalloteichus fjordicus]|uniref:DNA binding protein with helix-turn-helix domain n=1 Tax=Actinoalloteichus fjordicus TaxID=1612552 RepID=A0AAC9PRZ8_9PSEU|nr:helix-turn-helix transcriptional regulator [Actinoalloteichus fjordicus]APU14301.1 DNA binding protein with helix-turn-helix domain [Actinoalloteichus fjordicus]